MRRFGCLMWVFVELGNMMVKRNQLVMHMMGRVFAWSRGCRSTHHVDSSCPGHRGFGRTVSTVPSATSMSSAPTVRKVSKCTGSDHLPRPPRSSRIRYYQCCNRCCQEGRRKHVRWINHWLPGGLHRVSCMSLVLFPPIAERVGRVSVCPCEHNSSY